MNLQEISVLESKFKRHKIAYQIQGYKVIIGNAKIDYTTLLGLVVLPLIILIGMAYYLFIENIEIFYKMPLRAILVMMAVLSISLFFLWRLRSNKNINSSTKTLYNKSLKIENKNFAKSFDKKNIQTIAYNVSCFENDVYEGTLFLVDNEETTPALRSLQLRSIKG
ncbi:hypothetical protein [uncultured Aquimarina sp.]|uniref:hypothetical protein n=1 Tax=uncultured Aquimarina sp. TaxID=575652 RepID=UPI0026388005|nr:hypothetical protein [uncultured Aquimarina sp.]